MWRSFFEKYGVSVEIIQDSMSNEDACLLEMWMIAKFKHDGLKLCNITDGGDGRCGYTPSTEEVEKFRERITGNKFRAGKKLSEDHIRAIRNSRLGIPHTEETRDKIRKSQIGKIVSIDTRSRQSASRLKPVSTFCGMNFSGAKTASEWLRGNGHPKASPSAITECCKGKRPHCYGYRWKYSDTYSTYALTSIDTDISSPPSS